MSQSHSVLLSSTDRDNSLLRQGIYISTSTTPGACRTAARQVELQKWRCCDAPLCADADIPTSCCSTSRSSSTCAAESGSNSSIIYRGRCRDAVFFDFSDGLRSASHPVDYTTLGRFLARLPDAYVLRRNLADAVTLIGDILSGKLLFDIAEFDDLGGCFGIKFETHLLRGAVFLTFLTG